MNIGIIVQARMGSTRFPGKILHPFYKDKVLIDVILENLHRIPDTKLIVATSINPENDTLENYLNSKGENIYRGSEEDVLNRFIQAAQHYDVNGIIRICSDNPFLDYEGLSTLTKRARESNCDYIGFSVNGTPSILTHLGFWGEYVSLNALKRVESETAINTPAHEHVTYHVYTHPNEYQCEWIECPSFLKNRKDIRLTVDNVQDLKNTSRIYRELIDHKGSFSIDDVVSYIDRHTHIRESMLKNIAINVKS